MTDILVTSAGRRVELVEAFVTEAERIGGKVHATDLEPGLSSACQVAAKAHRLPRVTAPDYADRLLELCKAEGIGMIVPTIDPELSVLAEHRERFADHGVHAIISDAEMIAHCRDKRRTGDYFNSIGLDAPALMDKDDLSFPCFAKPIDGSSGIGARLLENADQVTNDLTDDPKMMFMEFVDGSHREYTVDAYYDRNGKLRCWVPRERIAIRAGEVAKGVTRRNFVYDKLGKILPNIKGARGCLTVQVFGREEDGRLLGIEINPRFGGGYPLAHAAGANYPAMLVDEYLLGKEARDISDWEANLLMLRYDAKVLVHDHG